jgi:TonB family protein
MFAPQIQIPRSPFASAITLIVHGAMAAVVLLGLTTAAAPVSPRALERMTYVVTVPLSQVPIAALLPPQPKPTSMRPFESPKAIETTLATPPPSPRDAPLAQPPPRVEKPARTPPAVMVGAFGERAAVTAQRQAAYRLQSVGFENGLSQKAQTRSELGEVGSFDAQTGKLRTTAARAVATGDAGFGIAHAQSPEKPTAQASADTGFASDSAPGPERKAPRTSPSSGFASDAAAASPPPSVSRQVTGSGFAEAVNRPPATQRVQEPQPINRSVEVTFKPRPEYTEEARVLRIEGEVMLEVEFTADGQIRVLRLARGLGHGLDEMASRAVQQIRFNPALRNGVPVTSHATVNIVFRLT